MYTFPKKYKIGLVVILVLIGFRLWLPTFVLQQINDRLNDLGDFSGHVTDIDLHLFRGAYVIDSITIIQKESGEVFFLSPQVDLSVEWRALFKGSIVSEIWVDQPELNLKFHSNPEKQRTGTNTDWVDLITDLTPIKINTFAVRNGCIRGEWQEQNMDVCQLNMDLFNIQNVETPDSVLPSDFHLDAHIAPFSGVISIDGKANILSGSIPNFDMNGKVEKVDLTKGSELLRKWTNLDFEEGTFSVYSELKHKNADYTGYIKPIIKDAQIFALQEEDRTLWEAGVELIAQGVQELFENQEKETNATRYEFNGKLDSSVKSNWLAFLHIVENAFWRAIQAEIDHSIEYKASEG